MGTESLKQGGSEPAEGAPPPAPSFDARQFRNALGRFASGVTIITASYEGQTHGMTANAFVSVSLDPPLVLVSLDNRSYMHKVLPSAGYYGVSVLAENQERLSNHFAGRTQEGLHIRFTTRDERSADGGRRRVLRGKGDRRAPRRRPYAIRRPRVSISSRGTTSPCFSTLEDTNHSVRR